MGSTGVLAFFFAGKIVHYSDIAKGKAIWYRNDTIFGNSLKYTLFHTLSVRFYGRSPLIPNVENKRKKNKGGFYAGIYDKSVRFFGRVEE